ncbi:MAG: hypothetical protein HY866_15150, partial [Chloroflexi bacterium]|nr:hypothetical protein [Chloroflexota bacterium]
VGIVLGGSVRLDEVVLPQSGFYGLVIGGTTLQGTIPAEYLVQVQRAVAGVVNQGDLLSAATGRLTIASPIHSWTLQPVYSGDYLIRVETLVPGKIADLFILSAQGDILGKGMPAGSSTTEHTLFLEVGQQYTTVVSAGLADNQGDYRISLLPASFISGVGIIPTEGGDNVGRITDQHFTNEWQIQGQAERTLNIQVTRIDGDLQPTVSIYDQNGSLIDQQTESQEGIIEISVFLPADGLYRVLVSRDGDATGQTSGDYTISARLE